jgi:hypothetical protein
VEAGAFTSYTGSFAVTHFGFVRIKMKKWLKGLVSAAIGGAANAVTAAIVAPDTFNLAEGGAKLAMMAATGSILSVAMYLKSSPLWE